MPPFSTSLSNLHLCSSLAQHSLQTFSSCDLFPLHSGSDTHIMPLSIFFSLLCYSFFLNSSLLVYLYLSRSSSLLSLFSLSPHLNIFWILLSGSIYSFSLSSPPSFRTPPKKKIFLGEYTIPTIIPIPIIQFLNPINFDLIPNLCFLMP